MLIHNLMVSAFLALAQTQSVPIQSVTFEGNATIDSARLRGQLRMSREGGWYRPESLQIDVRNLERFYEEEGFLRVRIAEPAVELRDAPGRGKAAALRVTIAEGPRYTLGQVSLLNVTAFPVATLLQMCPIQRGQPYGRKKLHDWKDKLSEGYQTMGYIRFDAELREEVRESDRRVDVVLECREGYAYRVGTVSVAGDPSVNVADFKRKILVGEGGLYNPEMVSLSIQFLNQMRMFKPISQSDVEVKVDDTRKVVDIVFHVATLKKPS